MNKPFLKALAQHVKQYPEFFLVGPMKASNRVVVPIYPEMRTIYSDLPVLAVAANEVAKLIKKMKGVKIIAGTEVAGIPMAVAVSLKLNLPFVAVRKERKEFLNKVFIDGDYQKGQKAVLLDDAIGWGNTKKLMVQNAKWSGLIIKDIICLYDSYTHEPQKRKWFFQRQIKIKALVSREEIFSYLNKVGLISGEITEINNFYICNPGSWNKNKDQWQKFLAWKKNYLKTKKI